MTGEVLVSIRDRVATITLNAPHRRNALTLEMARDLAAAVEHAELDGDVGAIVIAANGPSFCAGADRSVLARADEPSLRQVYQAFQRVYESALPTVCAVGGAAVGAGCNLALAGDVRIVSRSARFDTRFLRLGVHCGGGHSLLLHNAAGGAASPMLLFGQVVDGTRAERIGLAWQCVDDSDLSAAAHQLAAQAASYDRELAVLTKDTLRQAGRATSHEAMLELELGRQLWSMNRPAFGISRVTADPAASPEEQPVGGGE